MRYSYTTNNIKDLIEPLRNDLLKHPVFGQINSIDDLKTFLEFHVFAVWDFMSLLKALQQELTCIEIPWIPKGSPEVRRLVNEIVLGEETDLDENGKTASHFELYISAMEQCGADTSIIKEFIERLWANEPLISVIKTVDLPQEIVAFMQFTFEVINSKEAHKIAAAFTFGREDLIPDMFNLLVIDLHRKFPNNLDKFIYYLKRHIELDSDSHGPLAMKMITELCGQDENKWKDCIEISKIALQKRQLLWDGVMHIISQRQISSMLTV